MFGSTFFIRFPIAFALVGAVFAVHGQERVGASKAAVRATEPMSDSARKRLTEQLNQVFLPKRIDFPAPVERPTLAAYFSQQEASKPSMVSALSPETEVILSSALEKQASHVSGNVMLGQLSNPGIKGDARARIQEQFLQKFRFEMPSSYRELENKFKDSTYKDHLILEATRKMEGEKNSALNNFSKVIIDARGLLLAGDPTGARNMAARSGDVVVTEAFSAVVEAVSTGRLTERTLIAWTRTADRLNADAFFAVLHDMVRRPELRNDRASLVKERWFKSQKEAEVFRPLHLLSASMRSLDLPSSEELWVAGAASASPVSGVDANDLRFLYLGVKMAFDGMDKREQELTSAAPLAAKSEFETVGQFEQRQEKYRQDTERRKTYLQSIRQLVFRSEMYKSFGSQAPWPWVLRELTYDADKEIFAGHIEVQGTNSRISVSFPTARAQAQKVKEDFLNRVALVLWQIPLEGDLRLRSIAVSGAVYSTIAFPNASTGVKLSRNTAQLVEAVEKEERVAAEAAAQAEAQRRQEVSQAEAKRRAEEIQSREEAEKKRRVALTPEQRRVEDMQRAVQEAPYRRVEALAQQLERAGGNCFLYANNLRGAVNMHGPSHPIIDRHIQQARSGGCL